MTSSRLHGYPTRWRGYAFFSVATLVLPSMPVAALPAGPPQPDTKGGHASTHIIIQATPGFARAAKRAHWNKGGQFAVAARTAMSRDLDDSCRRWNVRDIRPLFDFEFIHADLAAKHGLDRFFIVETMRGTNTPAMAGDFAKHRDEIAVASVDAIGGVGNVVPNDPNFDLQWGLHNDGTGVGCTEDADIDALEAWKIENGIIETPVIVAVVDSGVDPHIEFADRMVPGYNTVDDDPDATGDDCHILHGTHVAGIVGRGQNDETGMTGVCPGCYIMPIDVLGGAPPLYDQCSGTSSDLGEGITWAADNGADVINMSLQYCGLNGLQQVLLQNAVNFAEDLGAILVAATGNNDGCGFDQVAWPGRLSNTLAVGGITCDGTRALLGVTAGWTSNSGSQIDVVGPGDGIWSCDHSDGYQFLDGTSMATPHVSGIAALVKSYVPTIPNTAVIQLIKDTADDISTPGWDSWTGWGRVNAHQALLEAVDYPRIVESDPPSGAIDARRPHNPVDNQFRYGWNSVEITYPAAVGTVTAADFSLTQYGGVGQVRPIISHIEYIDEQRRRIVLTGPIASGACTTIKHLSSQTQVDLGYQPADVDGSFQSNAADIVELIDVLNEVTDSPGIWANDIDRSGEGNPADILEVIDLLNGAGAYDPWNNLRMPLCEP